MVRVRALEVVAGHRLVDDEQLHLARVHLAQVRELLVGRPVLGHGRDREERLLAVVERPRRVEHRAAERAQELRRPVDDERLVDEPDDVALAAERLDPRQLVACSTPRARPRRDARSRSRRGRGARGRPRRPARARRGSIRTRSRARSGPSPRAPPRSRARPASRIAAAVTSGSRRVWRSLASNSGRPRIGLPVAAGATSSSRCRRKRLQRLGRGRGRRPEPGQERGDVRVARRGRRLAGRDRLVGEARDAADPLGGGLGHERRDGSIRVDAQRRPGAVEDRRDPLQPARHRLEPDGERRELAGEQRVDPAAEHVDPHERVPRLLAQHVVVEPGVVQLTEDEVAVDPLAGVQRRVIDGAQLGLPAVDEREPRPAAGLGDVRPAAVAAMVADAGRDIGLELEQLVEEALDEGLEAGHGHLRVLGCAGRTRRRRTNLPRIARVRVDSAAMDPDPRPMGRTAPPFDPRPVTLDGRLVRLEPLAEAHRAGLHAIALDEDTWRWTRHIVTTPAEFDAYLARRSRPRPRARRSRSCRSTSRRARRPA